jgi:hypothetical protein
MIANVSYSCIYNGRVLRAFIFGVAFGILKESRLDLALAIGSA